MKESIKIFEEKRVRTAWNEDEEEWYFSVVDVVGILTDQSTHDGARNYWKVLKHRLVTEGNETVTNCNRLKLLSEDGKMRMTDVANTQQLFRLIQSIPSPKAEPFKLWMAQVAKERIDQLQDPELSINQAIIDYKRLGYSDKWINQRVKSIEVRKEPTDEWERRGVQTGQEYATLTDIITQGWSGFTTREYKQYKGLKKENLRDNMTNLELALNTLAEATTTELSQTHNPSTVEENRNIAKRGGQIVGNTRKEIEADLGKPVVSPLSAKKALGNSKEVKQLPLQNQ